MYKAGFGNAAAESPRNRKPQNRENGGAHACDLLAVGVRLPPSRERPVHTAAGRCRHGRV